jgi:4-diphosphocytidyl-2-C-methyl-D-erythritol kinase
VDTLTLHSYAKINLYLEVLDKRDDNYHNIKTLFERVDLADKITLKSRPDKKISVTCNLSTVPQDSSNLVCRSAKLLQDTYNIDRGVDIKIIKHIPVGAGLGGGSSNGASTLLGLNKLWRLNLAKKELSVLAGKIGSDLPFFIYDTPFALGGSRGDEIKPLAGLSKIKLWHILVVPRIGVSTPLIYRKWDKYTKTFGLTMPKYGVNIFNLALKKKDFRLIGEALFNSLQPVTARLYSQIGVVRQRLTQLGAKSILMSGSGPAVFGVVSSRKEALSLSRQLKKDNSLGEVFVTRTH